MKILIDALEFFLVFGSGFFFGMMICSLLVARKMADDAEEDEEDETD